MISLAPMKARAGKGRILQSAPVLALLIQSVCSSHVYAEENETAADHHAVVAIISMKSCCSGLAWVEAERISETELSALGFNVEVVGGAAVDDEEQLEELEKIGMEKNADCAFRIIKSPEGNSGNVDLWIFNRTTGQATHKTLPIGDHTDPDAASVAALRIVEVLGAGLLEMKVRNSAEKSGNARPLKNKEGKDGKVEKKTPPKAGTREENAVPAPDAKRGKIGLRAGLEALGGPGGTGVKGAVNLALRWSIVPYLSLEVEGLAAFAGQSMEEEEGRASFGVGIIRGWLLLELLHTGRVKLCAGIAVGALIAWSEGSGAEEPAAQADSTYTGYVGGTLQLAVVLAKHIWLRLGFTPGVSIPEVSVRFFGSEVATFGRPVLEGFLGLEFRIP